VKQNEVCKRIGWIRGKKRCAPRNRGVPDVECEVGKGSADGHGGVQNDVEGHKSWPKTADRD
jgi:hypothetical protein